MDEADLTALWNGFYSNFQGCHNPCQDNDSYLAMEMQAGKSILFETAGSYALDLLKSCGLFEADIATCNHFLWKLEEICLPKIVLMFEIFRSSAEIIAVSETEGHLGTQTIKIKTEELGDQEKIQIEACSSEDKKDLNNASISIDLSEGNQISEKRTDNDRSRNANDPETAIRRSGRTIRLASKFQGTENSILKTIKPEPSAKKATGKAASVEFIVSPLSFRTSENTDHPKVSQTFSRCTSETKSDNPVLSKPSLVCSYCGDSSYPSEKEFFEHWNNHEEADKGDLPFQCSDCQLKFVTYESLCSHFEIQHISIPSYHCRICELKFHSYKALKKHNRKNAHGKDIKKYHQMFCPICGVTLDNGMSLMNHISVHMPKTKDHRCDLCGQSFSTQGLAYMHSRTHLGLEVKGHGCFLCGKSFKEQKSLEFHIFKRHKSNKDVKPPVFQCDVCSKKFDCQDKLRYHSVRHLDVKPFSCEICGKGFLREKGLENHKRMHSGGGWVCHICGKSFVSQRVLEDHGSIHTGERPHVCNICGKRFRLRAHLRYHIQSHNTSKHIQCPHCPKTLRDIRSYNQHIMKHTGEKPWTCTVCGKGFVQELTLKKHMNLHNGENKYQCQVCLRSFVDKWGLLKHSTIHTGERPYECNVCNKAFRIKKGLEDHMKLHDLNLQIPCPLCPKRFIEKRHLDHHLRVRHQGERAFVCEICGDRFVNATCLKVHHRRHTGEKPYKCSYCPKTFNQHGSHAAHERCHRGERPYPCDMCSAAFITRSQLTIHRRKHLNDRPYQCPECDYAATTASLLKVHALKHSSEKPFRCSMCSAAFKRQNHLDVHARKHCSSRRVEEDRLHNVNSRNLHIITHSLTVEISINIWIHQS